jgi:hypothetical protein
MKEQEPRLMEIIESFNHSLVICNLIDDYIVKNPSICSKKSLLKKAKKARQLMSEIHQDAHLRFCIQHTPDKGKIIERVIHKKDAGKG